MNLVNAQEARRVHRPPGGLLRFAGALEARLPRGCLRDACSRSPCKILVERERERIAVPEASYWDLTAQVAPSDNGSSVAAFQAQMTHLERQTAGHRQGFRRVDRQPGKAPIR
jgi:DNA topoisomerase I